MELAAPTFLMTAVCVRMAAAATHVKPRNGMPGYGGGRYLQLDAEGAEIPPDGLVGEPVACEARREGGGRAGVIISEDTYGRARIK